jgi:AhpD family alkylhydroperoxidase
VVSAPVLLEPAAQVRAGARCRSALGARALLYGALDRKSSPLEPALRSLLTVRVSQINHCGFCVDINSATLLQRGISENKLWALEDWRTSNLFSERERVALEYAEAITRSDLAVTDDLMARLKRRFDDDAVVDLTALVAFQNMSSKFNACARRAAAGLLPRAVARRDAAERPRACSTGRAWL